METMRLLCCLLLACVCLSEARFKVRRPMPPPLPATSIFKKSWPIGPRISIGNGIHIGGSFPHKRMSYKPPNYRIRRPPMINVLPTVWKNQIPLRPSHNNHGMLPQRPPIKEFHSMNKLPEYSPEYRPEPAILPPTHRGGIDDDKGPIHTIPAPNLSLADKPYDGDNNPEKSIKRQQTIDNMQFASTLQSLPATNFAFTTIGTSLQPQISVTSPAPTQNQYEVTEVNEIVPKEYETVQPAFIGTDFDVSRLATVVSPDLQSNEVFVNQHPSVSNTGLIGTNIQFGQANTPMQTNLHSSLHVGFPGTAVQTPYAIGQQVPEFHVGHPAPAGPPLSATQLYELLNGFPQKFTEQYATGQQPQLQQHILQQQLGQLFQPGGVTTFSQPQMQSFNYDEQANKQQQQQQELQQQQQQQQQIIFNQEYTAGRIPSDYNIESELPSDVQQNNEDINPVEEATYAEAGPEHSENNIEYEEADDRAGQTTFFGKIDDTSDGIPTQFYTTLPNREAAEKLAALAAAGNVNSHLIGELRKRQQEKEQKDDPMPPNHKNDDYRITQRHKEDEQRYEHHQREYEDEHNHKRKDYQEENKQRVAQEHRQRNNHAKKNEKRPLRIMVPDDDEYASDMEYRNDSEKDATETEYEYENDDKEATTVSSNDNKKHDKNSNSEFGNRLRTRPGK